MISPRLHPLHLRDSFFKIMAAASSSGEDVQAPEFLRMLQQIIQKKTEHTLENQAWDQYEHLAEWLVHLGAIVDIKDTLLEPICLDGVRKSMITMSGNGALGSSWAAFRQWKSGWKHLTCKNRQMITAVVNAELSHTDAVDIIT